MKEKILEALKNNNDFISGEKLSRELGISRAAVWKHIKGIKEEGYKIESVSKKGYKLDYSPDLLTYSEIKDFLETKSLGRNFIHYDTIDSTNLMAKKLAREGAVHGTVVLAEEQTSGRGRLGRTWISPKGTGIWVSIILRPNISAYAVSKLTLLGAAAVERAMDNMGIDAYIKWPNDLVLNSKKICGILTEMSGEMDRVNYIVMGIGINVNMNSFPEEVSNMATSLKLETGKEVDRKTLLAALLNYLERFYNTFIEEGNFSQVVNICRKKSVLLGKEVKLINGDDVKKAKAVDLDEDGELVVQYENGTLGKVLSGEVSVRGLYGYV